MSHKSVVALHEDVARTLADDIQFGYGRQTDFNQIENKKFPYVWLAPLSASASYTDNNTLNYQKVWNCSILFFNLDTADSIEREYKPILDGMDIYVDKFINTLNGVLYDLQGDPVITNINQTAIFKDMTDICTGWLLTYQLIVPDSFDYCSIEPLIKHDGERC